MTKFLKGVLVLVLLLFICPFISNAQQISIEYPADALGNLNYGKISMPTPMIMDAEPMSIIYTVDTLVYNGTGRIDIVLIGDGFLAGAQQDSFLLYSNKFIQKFFTTEPFTSYKKSFNFYAIHSTSAETGVKHPNTATDCSFAVPLVPVSSPNNLLGSTFDYGNLHRMVYVMSQVTVLQILTQNFPTYDYACVIVNSPYYGGSGGTYPTATCNSQSSSIMIHEFGHRFASLADEYNVNSTCGADHPNVTNILVPLKWDSIEHSYFLGANYCNTWYSAEPYCIMRNLNYPFCKVCQVVLINKIKSMTPTATRRVLSELCTNQSCGPCVIFDPGFRTLMSNNKPKVCYIERHTSFPGFDSLYTNTSTNSQWYQIFYQMTSVPRFYWDGVFHFSNDAIQDSLNKQIAKPSYLNISGTYKLNAAKDSVKITINLGPLSNINGNLFAHFDVKFGDPARKDAFFFPGKYGALAISSLINGQGVSYVVNAKLPAYPTYYNKDSLKVIIYVQDHTTKEVFNSNYAVKEVTVYPTLNVTTTATSEICYKSGTINTSVSGGQVPYTYIWSNGKTTANLDSLIHGTYYVTVYSTDNQTYSTSRIVLLQTLSTPTNVFVSNIKSTSAKLNCSLVSNANKYQFKYRKVGTTTWTVVQVPNPYRGLTGLTASTTYEFSVRARCLVGITYKNSAYSAIVTFTTAVSGAAKMELLNGPVKTYDMYDMTGRNFGLFTNVNQRSLTPGVYLVQTDTGVMKLVIAIQPPPPDTLKIINPIK